jgi:hypothetical protein
MLCGAETKFARYRPDVITISSHELRFDLYRRRNRAILNTHGASDKDVQKGMLSLLGSDAYILCLCLQHVILHPAPLRSVESASTTVGILILVGFNHLLLFATLP